MSRRIGRTPCVLSVCLATRDLTWPVGKTSDAVEFPLAKVAAYIGSGSYTVNCYSLGQLSLQHNFTMRR